MKSDTIARSTCHIAKVNMKRFLPAPVNIDLSILYLKYFTEVSTSFREINYG